MEAPWGLDLSLSIAPPERDASFMMILDIALYSVDRVAERMKLLTEEELHEICRKLSSMLDSGPSGRHAGELLHLQDLVAGRVLDFTPAMLQTAHPVQLRVLAAIKTKDKDLVDPLRIRHSTHDLADYLLGKTCLYCVKALPADDCECNLCATEKGFCSFCVCTICTEPKRLLLLRCVICNHGAHMDCVLNGDGYIIEAGKDMNNGTGNTMMLFWCQACEKKSELLKCVTKYLLSNFIGADQLLAEIKSVCKIFNGSTNSEERKLFIECSQLLASVNWSEGYHDFEDYNEFNNFAFFLQEMDKKEYKHEALERILIDATADPIELSYGLLENITNGFSQVIGRGGFGVVYMGDFQKNKVAVKKLSQTEQFSDKQFEDELACLRRVKHENIVRFLGYCSDTQRVPVVHKGQFVLAEDRRRFLCFEYAPNKSLRDYLKADSQGLQWDTHYKLIEGICHGLRYLHKEERITHLDLKPENILIDADMVPKIADFGLSRRFSGAQSSIISKTLWRGTAGYTAPEYWSRGEISFKADIFSLGIIIKEMFCGSIQSSEFDDWYQSQMIDSAQVERCIQISKLCVDDDPRQRPTMDYIIDMLSQKET